MKGDEKALNADSDVVCHNCKKKGHKKADCWVKGGSKEGQGPKQKKGKGKKSKTATVGAVDDNDKELFAFTCTSDYANVAEALQVPKSWLGTCINSGASRVYSPDSSKFANYKSINCSITTVDSRQLKAVGMGDLKIEYRHAKRVEDDNDDVQKRHTCPSNGLYPHIDKQAG